MLPTTSQVHYDGILQNVSIKYKNGMYIGNDVAPVISVDFQSDNYYVFSKADEFRDTANYRAPGTQSVRDGFTLSTDNYNCKEIAISTQLTDETRANADRVLRMETSKTNFVTNKILLKQETLAEATFMTTGNWAYSSTPGTLWSTLATSTPVEDIQSAIQSVETGNGYKVNTMILSKNVWNVLKFHPEITALLRTDATKKVRVDDLKYLFELDNIYIGSATKNTALPGATASYSQIWSKDVWLGYVNPNPGLEEASAVYTFSWNYLNSRGGEPLGVRGVRRWRDENVHSDIIEAYQNYDMKIVGSDLGYVLEGVIA